MSDVEFEKIRFAGQLRPSQADAVGVIRRQLDSGSKRLHIVAPPGSGKTVLGLYVWAELVKAPAVVFSPNTAIQSQWAARLDLFDLAGHDDKVSSSPGSPGIFTSLTYQSVTLPRQGGDDLDAEAANLWRLNLIEMGEAPDEQAASVLARNKQLVAIYQEHWNACVSPGETFYAHQGEGEEIVSQARQSGHVPQTRVHEKDVFV